MHVGDAAGAPPDPDPSPWPLAWEQRRQAAGNGPPSRRSVHPRLDEGPGADDGPRVVDLRQPLEIDLRDRPAQAYVSGHAGHEQDVYDHVGGGRSGLERPQVAVPRRERAPVESPLFHGSGPELWGAPRTVIPATVPATSPRRGGPRSGGIPITRHQVAPSPASTGPSRRSTRGGRGTAPPSRTSTRRASSAGPPPRVDFRPDIEGLRAVAVLLVVIFHAGVVPLHGGFVGVDVFFVISGFLITGLIMDELLRSGTVSISSFYARRVRRLLPAASATLIATALVFSLVVPSIDQPAIGADIIAASLWFANWHFAAASTDYFSAGAEHSPVLHFWSLSVEEQFYLFWPLLVLLVAARKPRGTRGRGPGGGLRARRARRGAPKVAERRPEPLTPPLPAPRTVLRRVSLALLPLGVISLIVSALTTPGGGPWAYFGVHTRAWELAAGGAVALARGYLHKFSTRGASLLGWTGLVLIVVSALVYDEGTGFPGVAALVPVLGAMAVLAAGARTQFGVASLLSRSWLTYVGRVSYSWYLWHWPCLELARRLSIAGKPPLDEFGAPPEPEAAALVLGAVASFLLAVVSYHLIETPARTAKFLALSKPRTFAFMGAVVAAAVVVPMVVLGQAQPPPATVVAPPPAAVEVESGPEDDQAEPSTKDGTVTAAAPIGAGRVGPVYMTPQAARDDAVQPEPCYNDIDAIVAPPAETCRFGDPAGKKVVVLFGDSHSAHWFPALDAAAKARGWKLYYWGKSACGYADVDLWISKLDRGYSECSTWRRAALERIASLPSVDAVLIGRANFYLGLTLGPDGQRLKPDQGAPVWSAGSKRVIDRLAASADKVLLLRDSPRPAVDIPACLSARSPAACAFPVEGHVHPDARLFASEQDAVATDGVTVVDLSPIVCSTDPCPVISPRGAIIYRDEHHLTGTYSREVAGPVGRTIAAALKKKS